jgi:hypothetical protein
VSRQAEVLTTLLTEDVAGAKAAVDTDGDLRL